MPVDEFIEEVTDGTPSVEGDLYAIQRNVAGVWTDYFIRAENIAGVGVFSADITIPVMAPGFNVILPEVPGKGIVLVDPPIVQVSGGTPTGTSESVVIGNAGGGGQWGMTFNDTETDAVYVLNEVLNLQNSAIGDLNIATSSGLFDGAQVRVRFSYTLADI